MSPPLLGERVVSYHDFVRRFSKYVGHETNLFLTTGLTTNESDQRRVIAPHNPKWSPKDVIALIKHKMEFNAKSIRAIFLKYDHDHSGELDYDEFRKVLVSFNIEMSDSEFAAVMCIIDKDNQGYVEMNDFIKRYGKQQEKILQTSLKPSTRGGHKPKEPPLPNWTNDELTKVIGQRLALQSKSVRRAFRLADSDKSGTLDFDEIRGVLKNMNIDMTAEQAVSFMKCIDPDGSGEIGYDEFLARFGQDIAGGPDTRIIGEENPCI